MAELTWCYRWSMWKAKGANNYKFLRDIMGESSFAMDASKRNDSPEGYLTIILWNRGE